MEQLIPNTAVHHSHYFPLISVMIVVETRKKLLSKHLREKYYTQYMYKPFINERKNIIEAMFGMKKKIHFYLKSHRMEKKPNAK